MFELPSVKNQTRGITKRRKAKMSTGLATTEERDQQRRAARDELEQLAITLTETRARHAKETTELQRRADEAQQEWLKSLAARNAALGQQTREIQQIFQREKEIQAFLTSTPPAAIDEWRERLESDLRQWQRAGDSVLVRMRIGVVRDLLQDIDALRLSCATEADAVKKIERSRRMLPRMD
jgi:predicted trehalose synthase